MGKSVLRRDDAAFMKLWGLVNQGKLARVKKVVAGGVDPRILDEDGCSLLTWIPAEPKPGIPMLEYLLDQGVPVDAPRREDEPLLLGWAAQNGDPAFVKLILARGADPDARGGEALCMVASGYGFGDPVGVAKLLLDAGADPDARFGGKSGNTAAMLGLMEGNPAVTRMLIAHGTDLKRKNGRGQTLLDVARELEYDEFIALLESKTGARPMKPKKPVPQGPTHAMPAWAGVPAPAGASPHPSGLPEWKKVFAAKTFPGCAHPPVHLLTVDTGEFKELPAAVRKLGRIPIVHAGCNQCDPEDFIDLTLRKDGRLGPVEAAEKGDCGRDAYQPSRRAGAIRFTKGGRADEGIQLFGRPKFMQARDDWPGCDGCGQARMFFLAYLWRFKVPVGAEGPGYHLYAFVCPPCRRMTVVKQMT